MWWELLGFTLLSTFICNIQQCWSHLSYCTRHPQYLSVLWLKVHTIWLLSSNSPHPCLHPLFLWVSLFLKYNQPTTLHYFLLYNIVIQYLYTFQNDHHAVCDLSPCENIIELLTVFPTLLFIPVTNLQLEVCSLNLDNLFLSSFHPSQLWEPLVCFMYLQLCLCLVMFVHLFFLDSTYKGNRTIFVFLCMTHVT